MLNCSELYTAPANLISTHTCANVKYTVNWWILQNTAATALRGHDRDSTQCFWQMHKTRYRGWETARQICIVRRQKCSILTHQKHCKQREDESEEDDHDPSCRLQAPLRIQCMAAFTFRSYVWKYILDVRTSAGFESCRASPSIAQVEYEQGGVDCPQEGRSLKNNKPLSNG